MFSRVARVSRGALSITERQYRRNADVRKRAGEVTQGAEMYLKSVMHL